jgi:quercetin dioxygenase-like cupin family protein
MISQLHPDALQFEEGPAFWFINSLVTVKATTESSGGAYSLVHQLAPVGFGTPYHRHAADEAFYVLEGEVTFFRDGERIDLRAGGYIFMPGGVAHGFRVAGDTPAAHLIFYMPGDDFIQFIQEMGEPATSRTLPQPAAPDMKKLAQLSAKYGSELLGPLPK